MLQVLVFQMVDLVGEHPCRWEMVAGHPLGEQLLELQRGMDRVAQDLIPVARHPGRRHQVHRLHTVVEA